MESIFWHERWELGQIGFHSSEVNPWLIKYWDEIASLSQQKKIFVPLCGKTIDILWLREQGYAVIGCEISPIAVSDFFTESKLPVTRKVEGDFEVWQSGNITIYCGDFFALEPHHLQGCDLIYDRASLIALPESMRVAYAKQLIAISKKQVSHILLITLEYPQEEMQGPPFSVSHQQVEDYYQAHFSIKSLSSEEILFENPQFKKRGLTGLKENVFLMTSID